MTTSTTSEAHIFLYHRNYIQIIYDAAPGITATTAWPTRPREKNQNP